MPAKIAVSARIGTQSTASSIGRGPGRVNAAGRARLRIRLAQGGSGPSRCLIWEYRRSALIRSSDAGAPTPYRSHSFRSTPYPLLENPLRFSPKAKAPAAGGGPDGLLPEGHRDRVREGRGGDSKSPW